MNEGVRPTDLKQRTKQLALRVVRLYSALPKTTESQVLGKQLLRAGTGIVQANLVRLNGIFGLPYIPELIERKVEGPEKGTLDGADLSFHEREYARLRDQLEQASEKSELRETPAGERALHDLLVRVRLRSVGR